LFLLFNIFVGDYLLGIFHFIFNLFDIFIILNLNVWLFYF